MVSAVFCPFLSVDCGVIRLCTSRELRRDTREKLVPDLRKGPPHAGRPEMPPKDGPKRPPRLPDDLGGLDRKSLMESLKREKEKNDKMRRMLEKAGINTDDMKFNDG